MQSCTICNAQSADTVINCANCGADLREFSSMAVALKRLRDNPRVKTVRLIIMQDACPACQEAASAYPKEAAPVLPVEGCSHALGCRCFYEPYLEEIYP
jgi:hypothetical protein